MRFKEKLTLTLRGYRMLHQLVPGAMLWAFVQNLVRALTPFLNVYLSGRIIDFLAQGRPLRDLLWLVGITVMVNALLKLTEQASGRTVDYLVASNTADLVDFPAGAYPYPYQSLIRIWGWNG